MSSMDKRSKTFANIGHYSLVFIIYGNQLKYVSMDGAVLGGDQAGAEALGHGGLKGHGDAV